MADILRNNINGNNIIDNNVYKEHVLPDLTANFHNSEKQGKKLSFAISHSDVSNIVEKNNLVLNEDHAEDTPASIPVLHGKIQQLQRKRVVFSRNVACLNSIHIGDRTSSFVGHKNTSLRLEDGLHLIDQLTHRSIDPMFYDSRLSYKHQHHIVTIWIIRIIVMMLCIIVGIYTTQFVLILQTDPRKALRVSLAQQLEQKTQYIKNLNSDINSITKKVNKISQGLTTNVTSALSANDSLINGSSSVRGEGIRITLSNPLATNKDARNIDPSNFNLLRVITDSDLQKIVSLLWSQHAEAIAVNTYRLGNQTSIRLAGQIILIGVNQIQSPYIIDVIGNIQQLDVAYRMFTQSDLYRILSSAGITIRMDNIPQQKLAPATITDITYAQRSR